MFKKFSLSKKIFLDLLIHSLAFIVVTTLVINYLLFQPMSRIKPIETSDSFKMSIEKKLEFSKILTSTDTILGSKIFDRDCQITGSLEDRKLVRWFFPYLNYKLSNFLNNFGNTAPYYGHVLILAIIMYLSFFFLFRTFELPDEYKFIYLFYVSFVFQNPLPEYHYSILETFFITIALYASRYQKKFIFIAIIILAQLNRESGFLISLTWLIFNRNEFKKTIIACALSIIFFIIFNFDIIKCLINPHFFISEGYFIKNKITIQSLNIVDVGANISVISFVKIILLNFIIPFAAIFYFYFKTKKKNIIILILTFIYLLVFLFALPLMHHSSRLLLLPILFTTVFFYKIQNK
jgi:hypothetical protein